MAPIVLYHYIDVAVRILFSRRPSENLLALRL